MRERKRGRKKRTGKKENERGRKEEGGRST